MKIKLVATIAALTFASTLWAGDMSALHPPAGARMALVVWEDLECPACAAADPLLLQAERNYGIPLVRHDFIIPNHNWSRDAHTIARYFDSKSPKLGEDFRQYIFANQRSIYNAAILREYADKFALAHLAPLPAFYDSDGKFHAMVQADTDLGKVTGDGVKHTPTIWVVTDSPADPPREVPDASKLFETIDAVKAALPAAPAKSNVAKGAKKKVSSKTTKSTVKSAKSSTKRSSHTVAKKETDTPPQGAADTLIAKK